MLVERIVKIINESGVHARPAAILVKTATQFKCEVSIESNGSILNGKSIPHHLF